MDLQVLVRDGHQVSACGLAGDDCVVANRIFSSQPSRSHSPLVSVFPLFFSNDGHFSLLFFLFFLYVASKRHTRDGSGLTGILSFSSPTTYSCSNSPSLSWSHIYSFSTADDSQLMMVSFAVIYVIRYSFVQD